MKSYVLGVVTGLLIVGVIASAQSIPPFDPYDNPPMHLQRQFDERRNLQQQNEWLERQNQYLPRPPYNPC